MVECAPSEGGAAPSWGEGATCGDGGSGVVSDIGFGMGKILVDKIGVISCAHRSLKRSFSI
jgi:hypothetical protein